ncbi:cell wall-binding repeat-containing protein [Herbiconiux liangxiaofengii]|uniref:cell wall-binding repeat-containing protein n=1 Tax=Herbiconiux liangxiaofengii TaxID=3342795 RepID=UPI0035B9EE66
MLGRSASVLVLLLGLTVPGMLSAHGAVADELGTRLCVVTPPAPTSVTRFTGADRFAVSAAVSASTFPEDVPVAVIASGSTFPDALAGGAAAGRLEAPLLLVGPGDEAPAAVQAELTRLNPEKIIVLGGTASISTTLELTMERFAPTVRRVAGADRFEVSAALAQLVFATEARTIYVASGEVFPDALSAAAAAGDAAGPVLLVRKNEIPPAVESYLAGQRRISQIVVLGGPATISESVTRSLAERAPLKAIGGADRYAVSAATSGYQFCSESPIVFIASGEVFPDALSGSAAAIARSAPVLLVSKNGLPPAVSQELGRLNPQQIVVLGGENTISKAIELDLANYLRS